MKALVVVVAAVAAVAAFAVPAGAEEDDAAFCDEASWVAATGTNCEYHYGDTCNDECKRRNWRTWHRARRASSQWDAAVSPAGSANGNNNGYGTAYWSRADDPGTYQCVDFQTAHPTEGYYITVRNVIVHADGSYSYC